LGRIVLLVNWRPSSEEMVQTFVRCDAELAFADAEHQSIIAAARARLPRSSARPCAAQSPFEAYADLLHGFHCR
jgi:hypothetical protein